MIGKKELMAKARAFTISIDKLKENERLHEPSGTVADDYNKLLDLTTSIFPELTDILPPIAKTFSNEFGYYSEMKYDQFSINCEQIYLLLSEQDNSNQ